MDQNTVTLRLDDTMRLENALRLAQRKNPNLNQSVVSLLCGWPANAFSLYKRGKIPLTPEAVKTLAGVLQCSPADISPDLAKAKQDNGAPEQPVANPPHSLSSIQSSFLVMSKGLMESGKLSDTLCLEVLSYIHCKSTKGAK